MKTKFFALSVLISMFFCTKQANATIRRVGYFGTSIAGTDYADLQSAHDNANAGDTLLLFTGSLSATFTKKLVIISYGYFVNGNNSNVNLQAFKGTVSAGVTLNSGSDSTIFQGVDGLSILINALVSNILVDRCYVHIQWNGPQGQLKNWQVKQSYITGTVGSYYNTVPVFSNLLVENCLINALTLSNGTSTGVFNNNVFGTGVINFTSGYYTLSNNVFLSTTAPSNIANCIFYNNIATNNTIPVNTNNKPNVDISTVFVGYPTQGTYSADSAFVLKPGSPAKGTGIGSTDCGVFGGVNPYRFSGIPAIPSFYKITAPSPIATSNPYTITFSVRSNN